MDMQARPKDYTVAQYHREWWRLAQYQRTYGECANFDTKGGSMRHTQ